VDEGLYPVSRFPQGHPELALSISSMAALHAARGEYAEAEPMYSRVLAMRETLYPRARHPQGHSDLARSLNNPLLRPALLMDEGLYPAARYPSGHPALSHSLANMAALRWALGDSSKAERLLHRAADMDTALAAALAAAAPEATALNYLSTLPRTRDAYLSIT